jgi:phosphatidylserine/phosphatidylglycerophosphate/cardiolipin synthase-like enzyme
MDFVWNPRGPMAPAAPDPTRMNLMSSRQLRFPALAAFLSCVLTAGLFGSELAVFFGPTKAGDPNGLDTQTVKLIDSAKTRLNAAVHEVRLKSICDAFIRAHERGVKVRMVGEDKYYDNEFMQQLRAAGIETHSDENPNAIMHNKFVVADGERMLTGSYNLTNTCSYNNTNNLVVIADKAVCNIFDAEFEKLWTGQVYNEVTANEVHRVTLKLKDREVPVEIFFQPRNDQSEARVIELLSRAEQGIYVMQFAFFNGKVGKLLVEKAAAQKDVRAVIDYSMVFGDFQPFNQIGRLVESNIPFCIGDDPDGKVHHKVFTVDPDGANAMVLTGSANSSSAGFNKNAENIIVIHDKQIAQRYRDETLKLLHRLEHGAVTVKPRGLSGIGQVHNFDIMISSGGKPIKDLELSLPFHWRVGSLSDVSAWRGDQANLRSSLKLASRVPSRYTTIPVQMVLVDNVNLTASGPASTATVRIKAIRMDPETMPGKFCIYARGSEATGGLKALASMPIIWLFRTANENVGYMAGLLESRDLRASTNLEFLVRDLDSSLGKDIEKDEVGAVKDFVFLMEKAKEAGNSRFKIVASLLPSLVQRLNFRVQQGGREAAAMSELITRLKALGGKRG